MEPKPSKNPGCGETTITPPQSPQIPPIFVTVDEAARILGAGTSAWTVYELIKAGDIEARRRGRRRLMVVLESLREYAANLPAASTAKDTA